MTTNEKAENKVNVAIDKMVDLQQDFTLPRNIYDRVQRVLDSLNELRSEISCTEKGKIKHN